MNFCDLEGKTALVTGATGGIGEEISHVLKEAGASLVVSGTNTQKVSALAEKLGCRGIAADLSQRDQRISLVEEAGEIDILINNAGITCDGLFPRQKDEDWDRTLEINLTAARDLCKGVLKNMMKKRFGRIINITSIIGHTGNAGQTSYAASKAALTAFSQSLAKEVGKRGITVNCIAPGFIETAMTHELSQEVQQQYKQGIATDRFGTSTEVAHAIRFLASAEAGYITGTTLHVNGGLY